MILGAHVSYSKEGLLGCVKDTLFYGGNTFMFYTGAPQNTIRKPIDLDLTKKAHDLMKENEIDPNHIVVHAPYIINLASANKANWNFSISFLKEEINRVKELGIKKLVLHPGNAVGIPKEEGLINIVEALKQLVNDDVEILLETMAGKGTECGNTLEELNFLIEPFKDKFMGICIDTCHLHDSGVDISKFDKYLDDFDKLIGLDKLKCIHVNDSKNPLGFKKDRHENFGFGKIGFEALINVIYNKRVEGVPKILETPHYKVENNSYPPYKEEMKMIKSKTFNPNLEKDTIKLYNSLK
jgi:deoxyribonuclease-4